MNTKKVKGFTLIELMVVVAIIAILAAIAIPMIFQYRVSANRAKCVANMKQIQNMVESIKAANGGSLTAVIKLDDEKYLGTTGYFKTEPKCPNEGSYGLPASTAASEVDTWMPSCSLKDSDPYFHKFE